jgi:hypothetical protein
MKNADDLKRYFPKDYVNRIVLEDNTEFRYTDPDNTKHSFMAYRASAPRNHWLHYRYKSHEEMLNAMTKYKTLAIERYRDKVQQKAVQKAANESVRAEHAFVVGDIVVNTWGYEQTNVEFYEVIRIMDKSIEVRQVASKIEEGSTYAHGMACNVLPSKGDFLHNSKPFVLRLKAWLYNGKAEVGICNPKSYYYFRKWEGKPQYNSWYA